MDDAFGRRFHIHMLCTQTRFQGHIPYLSGLNELGLVHARERDAGSESRCQRTIKEPLADNAVETVAVTDPMAFDTTGHTAIQADAACNKSKNGPGMDSRECRPAYL
jgi:hypothetical protein